MVALVGNKTDLSLQREVAAQVLQGLRTGTDPTSPHQCPLTLTASRWHVRTATCPAPQGISDAVMTTPLPTLTCGSHT